MPTPAPSNATPLQLWNVAQRITKQHGRQTATVVLKEYIQGQHPDLGDNTAMGIAKDLTDGDSSSFERLTGKRYSDGNKCGCDDNTNTCRCVHKSEENPDNTTRELHIHKSDSEFIIRGPASVSIVDSEGDKITGPALKEALPQLLKRANLSLEHMDIQPGEILEKWEAPDGTTYKTEVREVTKADLEEYEGLAKAGVEPGDDALFLVAKVYDDTGYSQDVRKQILNGTLRSFSISGQAVSERTEQKCDDAFNCKLVNVIEKLDLSAVTLCETPMNQAATGFKVLSKAQKREAIERGWMTKTDNLTVNINGQEWVLPYSDDTNPAHTHSIDYDNVAKATGDGFPGGMHGMVKALTMKDHDDDRDLCDCIRRRAAKVRKTLDGFEPESDEDLEVLGLLAALVDAAEEDEPEEVRKAHDALMRAVNGDPVPEEDPDVRDAAEDTLEELGEDDADGLAEDAAELSEEAAEADVHEAHEAAEEALLDEEPEYEADMKSLVKQLPPDTDHDTVEPRHGTPSMPNKTPTYGEPHDDSALDALDAEYNPDYPGNADRMDGAGAGPYRDAVEGEREDGELEDNSVEKSLASLVKVMDDDDPRKPTEAHNEEYWDDDLPDPDEEAEEKGVGAAIGDLVLGPAGYGRGGSEPQAGPGGDPVDLPSENSEKAAPEGVAEDEYDSCVEQVKEEGDTESAYAVCADALKSPDEPCGHCQDEHVHKIAMATMGFDTVYNRDCPTCYKLKAHTYDDAHAYFDAARHLHKTGGLRIGWLSPRDSMTLREEQSMFREQIPTVGSQ